MPAGAMRVAALVVLAACAPAPTTAVEVVLPDLDAARLVVEPEVPRAPSLRGVWLQVPVGARVRLRHPEGCPTEIAPGASSVTMESRVKLVAPAAPVGWDREVTVELRVGCGPSARNERSVSVRTPKLERELPWGIVPFAPGNRGEVPVELSATVDGVTIRRTAVVAAAARATGVPSVSAATTLYLGGDGWRVVSGPPGAELASDGGVTTFAPRRTGRFELEDGAGRKLAVRAGRHDETPLDCGRAECHPRAAEAVKASRMTTVFRRAVEGALGKEHDLRCALACHTVSEPGLADGGFVDVAAQLGVSFASPPARGAWAALPRALRRLANVGCTACHGPGAIPEDSARWSILRADVCATCHDAPPRYPLVATWRASRLARADAHDGATAPGCRDCHTTAGFLDAQKLRKLDLPPPADVGPLGIACAACHAPHDAHGPTALVRALSPPPALGGDLPPTATSSSVCLPCHAPPPDGVAVSSAAAIWLGRGGTVTGPAPHAAIDCVGCHDAHDPAKTRCAGCHDAGPPAPDPTIATRAAALWARAGGGTHLAPGTAPRDLSLVVFDRAAAVHNPAYARALLDAAERVLGGR